jgi:hypothetical protein
MADEFNKEIKSNRLLQSLRYTAAAQDNQEAFTRVLDLNATEVYTQQQFIPSSSLPFNDSSGHLKFITASIGGVETNIAQYYFEMSCSKSSRNFGNSKSEVWFAVSGSGFSPNPDAGIGSTIIEGFQQTDWLSNKYITASLALATADDSTPGYNVRVKINNSNVSSQDYQFDYKTGVLQFVTNNVSPNTGDAVTLTGYRYVGKTLANETFGGSGGGSGIFAATGSVQATTNNLEITGSLLATGSVVDFSEALAVSASNLNTNDITANDLTVNDITAQDISAFSLNVTHLTSSFITASQVVTSGSNIFGDSTTDTQTLIGTVKMTGSVEITGSTNISGTLSIPGFNDVSASLAAAGTGGANIDGIFSKIGSTDQFQATSSLKISGSTLFETPLAHSTNLTASEGTSKYAFVSSQSLWHYNANVGVPTSNPWKSNLQGSFFNSFDHNTDIAEILRFMAGLLSSSAPSSSPNTQTYNSITATQGGTQTGTAPAGHVPLNFSDPTVTYLQSKGFASTGNTLFNGIGTINDFNGSGIYKRNYSSAAGGSTSVSSSVDAQLFGLGTIGLEFAVSGGLDWFFADNSSRTQTTISSSENLLTKTGAGTSDGLTIGTIKTANPAVIPNEFQDGKFANVFEAEISDINSAVNYESTESVGFYQLTASIQIRTGSGALNFSPAKVDDHEVFYAPVDELNAKINANSPQSISVLTSGGAPFAPFSGSISATSRSLSGAPYLRTAEWGVTSSFKGIFSPLYAGNTTSVAQMTKGSDSDSIITLSTTTTTLAISAGSINTNNVVFSPAGVVKNTGTPDIDDEVRLSGSIQLIAGPDTSKTNIRQDNILDDYGFTLTNSAKNRTGASSNLRVDTIPYFDTGSFDQPVASGSMAYYGRAQGYDAATATGTTETFVGEDFRRKINDALLSVTSADDYGTAYSDGLVNASLDLQVKPGFLVKPGGTYKYWLPTTGTSIYRYYAREFDTGGSTFSSMTINVGKSDLKKWTNTTDDGIAIGILYASGASGKILIDVADFTGGNTGATTPQAGLNPFGVNIDIKSNSQSPSNSGTNTYQISMNAGKSVTLNASNRIYQVIIRYKENSTDQIPITGITVAYQA